MDATYRGAAERFAGNEAVSLDADGRVHVARIGRSVRCTVNAGVASISRNCAPSKCVFATKVKV